MCSGPFSSMPVVSPHHVTSLGIASVISTPHDDTYTFFSAGHVKFQHIFFSIFVEILNYDNKLCPLDCMVAVTYVGLLSWES